MNDQLITLDNLIELGVDIENRDTDALLQHLNEKLDERVGIAVADVLKDEQLRELAAIQDKGDDDAVGEWMDANIPKLKEIAEDERDILLGELSENADDVLA